jgi:hypothetical protein
VTVLDLPTSVCCPGTGRAAPPPGRGWAGFAHRDQQHRRPLLDSLDHGVLDVEVDVWLEAGELLVGHDRDELDQARTLEALYLGPLRALADAGRLPAYGVTLAVDLKTPAGPAYAALEELLGRFGSMLTSYAGSRRCRGIVSVLVTGQVPPALLAARSQRLCALDGRLHHLGGEWPAHLVPTVSADWTATFGWRGVGPMPAGERALLHAVAAQALAEGRALRFWATPDEPGPARDAVWRALGAAGVGLVNSDDLCGLAGWTADRLLVPA